MDNLYHFGSHRSKRLLAETYDLRIILAISFDIQGVKNWRNQEIPIYLGKYLRNSQGLDVSGILHIFIILTVRVPLHPAKWTAPIGWCQPQRLRSNSHFHLASSYLSNFVELNTVILGRNPPVWIAFKIKSSKDCGHRSVWQSGALPISNPIKISPWENRFSSLLGSYAFNRQTEDDFSQSKTKAPRYLATWRLLEQWQLRGVVNFGLCMTLSCEKSWWNKWRRRIVFLELCMFVSEFRGDLQFVNPTIHKMLVISQCKKGDPTKTREGVSISFFCVAWPKSP